jgi:multiple sugar transport system permease protein
MSFTDVTLLKLRQGGSWVGLRNYVDFVTEHEFGRLLFNTVVWLTAISVVVRLLLGLAIALLIDAPFVRRIGMTTVARLAILIPWATPPIVAVAVWRWLLDPALGSVNAALTAIGLVDEPIAFLADTATVWPAIVTIIVWNTVPLVALSLLASLQAIPAEIYEAAVLDGANGRQCFRHVTLPFLMPTIVILGLMSTIWTFNNFAYVWLATGAGPGTFTNVFATEIYIRSFVDLDLGRGAAIGMVMAAVMAVFGVLYFRLVASREFDASGV